MILWFGCLLLERRESFCAYRRCKAPRGPREAASTFIEHEVGGDDQEQGDGNCVEKQSRSHPDLILLHVEARVEGIACIGLEMPEHEPDWDTFVKDMRRNDANGPAQEHEQECAGA